MVRLFDFVLKKAYILFLLGFVPNDQSGYVEKLRRVIQQSKITQFGQGPPQQQQQQAQQPQQMQQIHRQVRPMMGMGQANMPGNQNMMQGDQNLMINPQARIVRPNMMAANNNLRHLLQQQQTQFRPQMGGSQQQGGAPNQMQQGRPGFDGMDPSQFDMNFQMN